MRGNQVGVKNLRLLTEGPILLIQNFKPTPCTQNFIY